MDNVDNPMLQPGIKASIRAGPGFQTMFVGMKIQSAAFLDDVEGRMKCPKCSRSRKFFCYSCYLPMTPLEGKLPIVKLPIALAVVKHPLELDGKSTATHGPILAPESVKIFEYPNLPNTDKSILMFPSADAEDAGVFMERVKSENEGKFPYDQIIFVDSTWKQTNKIRNDPKLRDLPKVKLCGIESLFWRYQRGNPVTHLATIEAMYHFCVAYHKAVLAPQPEYEEYDGEYDNLLFFFKYMFLKVRGMYDPKTLKSYASRPYLQEKDCSA